MWCMTEGNGSRAYEVGNPESNTPNSRLPSLQSCRHLNALDDPMDVNSNGSNARRSKKATYEIALHFLWFVTRCEIH